MIVVQSVIRVQLFATPWTAACQASLSFTVSWSLLKLVSIELVMPSNHLILIRPLLLPPSVLPNIRVFSTESVLRIRWLNYWSVSLSVSPSNEYSGLISFSMDWLDLLAVQGSLKSLLQHHGSKASIFRSYSLLSDPALASVHDCWGRTKAFFIGSVVKTTPANAGDVGWIPGREDPLKEEMATHSSILTW